ncbi:MAG: hypothetical protein IJD45_03495 [Clostridia bacterium]|nr:hypothetical protein [Clostridia bacterium]
MIILTVIFVGIAAFLMGLIVSNSEVPQKRAKKSTEPLAKDERLQKEYENFLYYDGSVQQ